MAKRIQVGGRIECKEVGGIVTGAAEILDDAKGKKQSVINGETEDELLRLDQSKQDNLTFDNAPTEGSNNPVKSGGVYAADKALSDAIEAILLLIPSAASALNKLVDTSMMNSSISTATATFRGTYNVVTDLSLTVDATHEQIAAALGNAISTADNNDYVFVQIPVSEESTDIRRTERYKFNGTAWGYEYDLNTSGFTAAQWAAINSGITLALVGKLIGLPTSSELQALLGQKQNTLTFDNVPTAGSANPVKSGGVHTAINDEKTAREQLANTVTGIDGRVENIEKVIPTGAADNNKLVANSSMEAYVTSIIEAITASFTIATADGHINFTLTQTNGRVASLTLTSSDIASAQALTALTGRVSTAEGNITTLGVRVSTNETDIANLQQLYNNLQQSKPVPVTELPSTGQQQGVIYRLAGTTSYSDYMWNGSTWVLMATYNNAIDPRPKKASQNLVTSGGVFDNMGALDVSELNATENTHTLAQYVDLSAALAAIPTDYQKGGMSIKFVQSSDNKYVQHFCNSQTFTTNISDWEKQVTDSQLRQNEANLSKNLSILDLMDSEVVTPTEYRGVYCNSSILYVPSSTSTVSYGALITQVNAGDIVKIKTDKNYTINNGYANVFFVKSITNGIKPVIIGYIPDSDIIESTEKNYYYIATEDGFVGVSYFSNLQSKTHTYMYDRTMSNIVTKALISQNGPSPKSELLAKGGDIFDVLRNISKKLFCLNLMDSSKQELTDYNSSFCSSSTGKININSPVPKSYGLKFVAVSAGDCVKISTEIGYRLNNGYVSSFFVESVVDGAPICVIGYAPNSDVTEAEKKEYFFIAPKDGYVGVSYFNNQTTQYAVSKYINSFSNTIATKEYTKRLLPRDINITFPNIGSIYYPNGTRQDNVGSGYASSDIIETTGFVKIDGKLRGNNDLASVLFLDEEQQALTELSVAFNGLQTLDIDLTDSDYEDVKYIVLSIKANSGVFDSYASLTTGVLYEESLAPYQKQVATYKKYSAIGDSLTNSSPWINTVKDILKIEEVTRAGAAGLTMADMQGSNSIHSSIMAMQQDNDVDLISIWAGTNDYSYAVPLGDFETQYAAAQRDTTTFYGAFMDSIEHILTTFPKARLFLVGTTDRIWRTEGSQEPWKDAMVDTYHGVLLPDYVDAVKKLAERYGLPFLDLLRTSGINKHTISQYMFLQTSSQGNEYYLHFNEGFGTQSIAKRIAAFINSIG